MQLLFRPCFHKRISCWKMRWIEMCACHLDVVNEFFHNLIFCFAKIRALIAEFVRVKKECEMRKKNTISRGEMSIRTSAVRLSSGWCSEDVRINGMKNWKCLLKNNFKADFAQWTCSKLISNSNFSARCFSVCYCTIIILLWTTTLRFQCKWCTSNYMRHNVWLSVFLNVVVSSRGRNKWIHIH